MHKKLFIPGPTEVRPELLKVVATPQVGHRTQDYKDLHAAVIPMLKKILYTDQEVLIFTCSATGVMEGTVRNLCQKKVLCTVNGAFSKRWFKINGMNGIPADKIEVEWGKAVLADQIDAKLKTGEYDVFCMVFNETSTGVRAPVEEVAAVMKKYPDVMFCIDAVSAMAGDKIECDKLGIDVCLAGTQKCWGLPTGVCVTMISNKAMERAKTAKAPGYYVNFVDAKEYNDKHQTPHTPAIPLIFGLKAQCEHILNVEGLDNRWARHIEMAKIVRNWAVKSGFAVFPEKGYESNTLTCITNTKGISIADLNKTLAKQHSCIISNGYGDLKEKTFRIAHMADVTVAEIKELLGWLDEIIPTMPKVA
ncbi:alanine--glyoxylate aminotransferase family protein [bacterium]|nr:alanine--glyoxylate aminotransferase family protein [bacterium]MBU1984499.1 alanine--glyoxylate aminotransferase family protein [bacterium]